MKTLATFVVLLIAFSGTARAQTDAKDTTIASHETLENLEFSDLMSTVETSSTESLETLQITDLTTPIVKEIEISQTPEAVKNAINEAGFSEENIFAMHKMVELTGSKYKATVRKNGVKHNFTYSCKGELLPESESK